MVVKERLPIAYHEWRPDQTRVSVGLQQLAFATFANALEDAMGRTTGVCRQSIDRARRRNAAAAIRWLRSAGRGDLTPFTPDWCAHLLGVDARWLARHGVARVSGGGLTNWREWRAHRTENRIQRAPRLTKICRECRKTFTTKNPKQTYCSVACAHQARVNASSVSTQQQVAERAQVSAETHCDNVPNYLKRYKSYVRWCLQIWRCEPASEVFWNLLSA